MSSRTVVFLLSCLLTGFFYFRTKSQIAFIILLILGIYLVLALIQMLLFGRKLSFRLFLPEKGAPGTPVPGELLLQNDSWLPVSCVRCVLYAENNPGDWEAEKKRDFALVTKGQKSWLFAVENGEPGSVRVTLDRLEISDPLGIIKRNIDLSDIMLGKNRIKYLTVGGKQASRGKSYLKIANRSGGPSTRNNTSFSGVLGRIVSSLLVGVTTFLMLNEMLDMGWTPADAVGAKFMSIETAYMVGIAAVCALFEFLYIHLGLLVFIVPEMMVLFSLTHGELHPLTLVMHVVSILVAFAGARSESVSAAGYINGLIITGIMLLVVL